MPKNRTVIYFLGSAAVSILGFVISILYSDMFTTSDYGVYSLVFSTYSLVSSAYGGWLSVSILRNAELSVHDGGLKAFYSSVYQFHLLMSVIFFIFANGILLVARPDSRYWVQFFIFSLIYFFEYFILISNTILRITKKASNYSINIVINSVGKILSVLFLYYVAGIRSSVAIGLSLLLTEIAQCLYLFVKLGVLQYFHIRNFSFPIIKRLLRFGYPLVGSIVASWILNASDRYIIGWYYSEDMVGLYSYAYGLGNTLLTLVIQSIMLEAFPSIVRAYEQGGVAKAQKKTTDYLQTFFRLTLPACFGVLAIGQRMFHTIVNPSYQTAWPIFVITCFAIFIHGLSQYSNKTWELTNRTRTMLFLTILAAICNIALNMIFLPRYGYVVAAWTTLASFTIYLVVSLCMGKGIIPLKINYCSAIRCLTSSVIMWAIISALSRYVEAYTLPVLFCLVVLGVAIYSLCLLAFKELSLDDLKKISGKHKTK